MCVYCNCGDTAFRHNPPWSPHETPWSPYIPQPVTPGPHRPWDILALKEYLELLRQIKEMEDRLGCPCEPNKANYIELFKERIKNLQPTEG